MVLRSEKFVAPFAGAWIEMYNGVLVADSLEVAPFAGAWIEIAWLWRMPVTSESLPSRERGLK